MCCLGRILVFIACATCGLPIADAQRASVGNRIELSGDLAHPDQLSGIAFWHDPMIACPDEGAEFNVLTETRAWPSSCPAI
jgi:hypothetical protein